MMEVFLDCCDGSVCTPLSLLTWRFGLATGVPCDSFYVECLWDDEGLHQLDLAVELRATWMGEPVFRGVLDEFELILDGKGRRVCLSGRGMAARLLDNEAVGMEYQMATLEDVLRDHVYPYGVEVVGGGGLPGVKGFAVSTGSSAWQVLYQFARYYGGVDPRFDRWGRLVLDGFDAGEQVALSDESQLLSYCYRQRRYGVISQMVVRDAANQRVERVDNAPFLALGGQRRQVLSLPRISDYQVMRYTGDYQIAQSQLDWRVLEVTLPTPFVAWPGERVVVGRTNCGFNGQYRVVEAVSQLDGDGTTTKLVLRKEG